MQIEVTVPESLSAGVYANGFSSWFTPTDFTLDFLLQQPTEQRADESGAMVLHQPFQVVARVKFSPTLIFRLIQNLNEAMTNYEAQLGPIVAQGDPIPPPADDGPSGS